MSMRRTSDETLSALVESLDADILNPDATPIDVVERELRAAGCDPAALVARCRPKIDALLAARRKVGP